MNNQKYYVYNAIDIIKLHFLPLNYGNVSQHYLQQVPMEESNNNSENYAVKI